MTKKKKHQHHNGSQKGMPTNEVQSKGKNVMAKEELEKVMNPTQTTVDED